MIRLLNDLPSQVIQSLSLTTGVVGAVLIPCFFPLALSRTSFRPPRVGKTHFQSANSEAGL